MSNALILPFQTCGLIVAVIFYFFFKWFSICFRKPYEFSCHYLFVLENHKNVVVILYLFYINIRILLSFYICLRKSYEFFLVLRQKYNSIGVRTSFILKTIYKQKKNSSHVLDNIRSIPYGGNEFYLGLNNFVRVFVLQFFLELNKILPWFIACSSII